jgi:hypothetical protein
LPEEWRMSSVEDKPPAEVKKWRPFAVEDGKVRLTGVEIGDWGALLALLVSIGTFVWTVTDKFILQPDPQIISPRTIEFFCAHWTTMGANQHCDADEDLNVRAGPVSVVNRAAPPHSYVLQSIAVDVTFSGNQVDVKKHIQLTWLYFSEVSTSEAKRTPAVPLLVEGGAAVAKEIEFYPRLEIVTGSKDSAPIANRRNFFKYAEFETWIGSGEVHQIKLTFNAVTLETNVSFSSTCTIPVDDQFVKKAKEGRALFVRDCSKAPETFWQEN